MANELLKEENLSTIATWVAIIVTMVLTYFGIQIDQGVIIALVGGTITLIVAIWSSKNPNDLEALGNGQPKITIDAESIKELVDYYQANNTIEVDQDDGGC